MSSSIHKPSGSHIHKSRHVIWGISDRKMIMSLVLLPINRKSYRTFFADFNWLSDLLSVDTGCIVLEWPEYSTQIWTVTKDRFFSSLQATFYVWLRNYHCHSPISGTKHLILIDSRKRSLLWLLVSEVQSIVSWLQGKNQHCLGGKPA